MSLPRRQQAVLNQIDRALGEGDPRLRSMYAAFSARTGAAPRPAREVITGRPVRHLVLALVLLSAMGFLAVGFSQLNGKCTVGNRTSCPAVTTTSGGH
jgi:hypothetical protein